MAGRLLSLLGLCATLACQGAGERETHITLEACRLSGLGVGARCGVHRVLEDRTRPDGRRIDLRVAVVPALASDARPDPLFVLVGGPGQAATGPGAQIAQALHHVRKRRDIVLVDQRGTGASGSLSCRQRKPSLEEAFAPVDSVADVVACRDALEADLTQYVTPIAMDDLDEVRRALGYGPINLWGASYGTRAALVYYQRHAESTRSLVLDGVAPTDLRLPLFVARDSQRALDRLLADCSSAPACAERFPDLREKLLGLLDEATPRKTRVSHPRDGHPVELSIDARGLALVIRNLLYVPELQSLLPLSIDEASRGNYAPLAAQASAFGEGVELSEGMFLSIVCNEDLARVSDDEIARETAGTFLGKQWLQRLRRECAEWPSTALPEEYFSPIVGDVPALIFSGGLDPVTPPAWGELVAGRLSRSRHVVSGGAGHGVSTLACGPERIADFLDTLDPDALDLECLEQRQRPPFFVRSTGP